MPRHDGRAGTHCALDLGALHFARRLAQHLNATLISGDISRRLVDLNRSPHHPKLLSALARTFPSHEQTWLRCRHARHWGRVERHFTDSLTKNIQILHIAVHSFTPSLIDEAGVQHNRNADIGLLYDPQRPCERRMAGRWQAALARTAPQLRVRRNYPYLGRSDGLATATRKRLSPRLYCGFELEINQGLLQGKAFPEALVVAVVESLQSL